ncbi:hypothetical protein ACPA54_15425 [Uniformispora flossi]|uniref:hypothetical protein n=1 Tax=Uniformispora flossi TaxID=3390723 RepID=UPI003C2B3583
MEVVQRLLARRRVDVTDAVLATYELLGAAPGALGDAKAIVLTSPGRRRELLVHQQVVEALEQSESPTAAGR